MTKEEWAQYNYGALKIMNRTKRNDISQEDEIFYLSHLKTIKHETQTVIQKTLW